ncbi:MAG TPA: hypothetical protein VFL15_10495 [Gammaproteobacteria bacterium]|nr:hypothetical protein [Gammaproteobacteria bacterium]
MPKWRVMQGILEGGFNPAARMASARRKIRTRGVIAMTAAEFLPDDAFVEAFENLTLDPKLFNHRGHLRLAWCYLNWLPLGEAAQRCADSIRRFATHHGSPEKFHLTMTYAFMHIVSARLSNAVPGEDFAGFCDRNPDLLRDGRALIGRYYSSRRLSDPAARMAFIEPDVMPLP